MRTEYARRRDAVLSALQRHVPLLRPIPALGGLHMVGELPPEIDQDTVVSACRERGIAVAPLHAYYAGQPRMNGLVLGFATTPVPLAAEAARRLAAALAFVTAAQRTRPRPAA
jgi:GntR family transcriptional regulator/MocR family aminotransferase